MKTIRFTVLSLSIPFILLISCSAIRQTNATAMERLKIAIAKGHNFKSMGETFDGDLSFIDLKNATHGHSAYIQSELIFENCTFSGNVILISPDSKSIYFEKEVIFEGCEFKGEFAINDATFSKRIQLGNNHFTHTLDLQRNSFGNSCRIDENNVGHDLILQYSQCHEGLSVFGNGIGRHLNLQGISVQGKSQLGNTTVYGSIDISSSFFHEDFSLDFAKMGKKLLAGNSKFFGMCRIRDLEEFEQVDFNSSQFYGKYIFSSKENLQPDLSDAMIYTHQK